MVKRLQVLLEESELRELQRIARARKMTVAEWVRQTLRAARRQEPLGDPGARLRVIRAAARHEFSTADIDQMLSEIERGDTGRFLP
jgi:hypothetical protein